MSATDLQRFESMLRDFGLDYTFSIKTNDDGYTTSLITLNPSSSNSKMGGCGECCSEWSFDENESFVKVDHW